MNDQLTRSAPPVTPCARAVRALIIYRITSAWVVVGMVIAFLLAMR